MCFFTILAVVPPFEKRIENWYPQLFGVVLYSKPVKKLTSLSHLDSFNLDFYQSPESTPYFPGHAARHFVLLTTTYKLTTRVLMKALLT